MNIAVVERGRLCNPITPPGGDQGRSITSGRVFCGRTASEGTCEQPRPWAWENSGQLLQHRPAPASVST